MNVEPEPRPGRADLLIDRATRVVRLLAWLAMFALCCLMLWVMSGMAAQADDPKAAARELGQGGNAAAGAIARDASTAGAVPGYVGTNVPERSLTDGTMDDAARARLGRSGRSRRRGRARDRRGHGDTAREAGVGERSGSGARRGGGEQSAICRPRCLRPRFGQRQRPAAPGWRMRRTAAPADG